MTNEEYLSHIGAIIEAYKNKDLDDYQMIGCMKLATDMRFEVAKEIIALIQNA